MAEKINLKDDAIVAHVEKQVAKAVKAETARCVKAVNGVEVTGEKNEIKAGKAALKAAVAAIKEAA